MKIMQEFDFPLAGSAEEIQQRAEIGKLIPYLAVVDMPEGAIIRRISGRIKMVVTKGVHPQTKVIGNYAIPKEHVSIWAEVDETKDLKPYKFYVIPTGAEIPLEYAVIGGVSGPDSIPYLGSFLLEMGAVAFHVYGPSLS